MNLMEEAIITEQTAVKALSAAADYKSARAREQTSSRAASELLELCWQTHREQAEVVACGRRALALFKECRDEG